MTDFKPHDKDNLIDLASQRRRIQDKKNAAKAKMNGKNPNFGGGKAAFGPRWYHYLQLIVFLLFLSFVMTKCQGGF